MKVIVGLGNPGKQYQNTRHNMGYMVIDALCDMFSCDLDYNKFKGIYGICKHPSLPEPVIFAKPETFMNLSGEFIRPLLDYFKLGPEDLLVIYDDMAIPEGKIRLRLSGSHGSHNGMRNIIDLLHTENIKRIRVGIGEPPYSGVDYVLTKPTGDSAKLAEEAIEQAAKATRDALLKGFNYAMNHYN
ncbi:MAG: aminoacyl-tRNA hydrolase [Bacilli bacterium]|nr:aminoacyl-tRNA hydrolase [Bacilli bacterium]MBO6286167.1 aminoacyl-tRNA hydrolase [Bacilli bacterium]